MLKQKYVLATPHYVPMTSKYVTAYLQLRPNSNQLTLISRTAIQYNNLLRSRMLDLRRGYFKGINIPFKLSKNSTISGWDWPWDALSRGIFMKNLNKNLDENNLSNSSSDFSEILMGSLEGRLIGPSILEYGNEVIWPKEFYRVTEKLQTLDFHISLMPLVQFENFKNCLEFKKKFTGILGSYENGFDINFNGKIKVMAKYDFMKFFLTMIVNDNNKLSNLIDDLSIIRRALKDPGYAIGEQNGRMLDWKEALHLSIGVSVLPKRGEFLRDQVIDNLNRFSELQNLDIDNPDNFAKKDSESEDRFELKNSINENENIEDHIEVNNLLQRLNDWSKTEYGARFGMFELFYLNEVLLKPKNELLEEFGAEYPQLENISDVDTGFTGEELQDLECISKELCLIISNNKLVYKL